MAKKVILEKLIRENKENAIELSDAENKVIPKNDQKGKDSKELKIKELIEANKRNALELTQADKLILEQREEIEKQEVELIIASKELVFQTELKIANENLEQQIQLNADKNLFISILAHDLRSPFTVLLGLSEFLVENLHKYNIDEIEESLINLNKSAQSTFALLEDLLKWARMHSGKIQFNPQKLNFSEICKDFLEIFKPSADSKNITFNCLIIEETSIWADSDMFKAILRNIFSNAIKFTNKDGQIDIHSKKNQKDVTITISDTGIGITSDNLKKLFDISQIRSTKGTNEEGGSGLGLVLCKEFVEKNGGKIWVESEYGKGSKFIFTMPVYTDQLNTQKTMTSK
jgi:signal transduction histidine kinase